MTDNRLDRCIDNIAKAVIGGQAFRDKFNERYPIQNREWNRRNQDLDSYVAMSIDRIIKNTMRQEFHRYVEDLVGE